MKYLIFGLGNPEEKYKNTRHNIGFKILDRFAEKTGNSFESSRYADVAEIKHKGRKLILIKPTTYMNNSGKAVNYWLQKEKNPIDRILVITDDVALPLGKIRIRKKGSAGGHNGLLDIEEKLGGGNYPRLRFGIGNEYPQGQQVKYVLSNWTDEEAKILPERSDKCIEAIKSFATIGIDNTMSEFNNK